MTKCVALLEGGCLRARRVFEKRRIRKCGFSVGLSFDLVLVFGGKQWVGLPVHVKQPGELWQVVHVWKDL